MVKLGTTLKTIINKISELQTATAYSSATITSFSSGWAVYEESENNFVIVRRFGRVCALDGRLKNTAAKTINASEQTAFTIPSGFRPNKAIAGAIFQGSNMAVWTMAINLDGEVKIGRYRDNNSSSYPSVGAGAWFPFHITYMCDE